MIISMPKMKFLCLPIWTEEHMKEKYQNGCHLKTRSQNDSMCNQHILGAYMHIYTKDEVCMTIYSELSIDSKPMKSTKMSVSYKL